MDDYSRYVVSWKLGMKQTTEFVQEALLEGIQKFEPISRSHEGLVDILQIGRNDRDGYFYYVMELADDEGVGQTSLPAGAAVSRNEKAVGGKDHFPLWREPRLLTRRRPFA